MMDGFRSKTIIMNRKTTLRHIGLLLMVVIAATAIGGVGGRADAMPPPPMADIEKAVLDYFKGQPGYRPGDLITQKQVEPLLARLQKMGLPLPEKKEILDAVPVEGEFLVKALSTTAGRKFMRRIARFPDAYDRVDRLSHLPIGQQTVRDLIRGPDGYKMIQYMTTAEGGIELGKQLSNTPDGKKFNAPTGRIYTAAILLERLEASRAASIKAAGKQPER